MNQVLSPGWLFLSHDAVPPRWRERAVQIYLVPLMPGEAAQALSDDPIVPDVALGDEELLRLAARGLPINAIARRLEVTPRNVYRRLAKIREQLGVSSNAEMRALLARLGFWAEDP